MDGTAELYRRIAVLGESRRRWTQEADLLESRWRADVRQLRTHIDGIERATTCLEDSPELFAGRGLLSMEERYDLWGYWQSFLDYEIGLESIKNSYRDFAAIKVTEAPEIHLKFFLATYAAFLVQVECGLRVIALAEPVRTMHTLLNEEVAEFGIHPRTFSRLKWNVIHVSTLARATAARGYLHLIADLVRRYRGDSDVDFLLQTIRRMHRASKEEMKNRGPAHFVANTADILRGRAFRAWFPVQKKIAHWFGESRLKERMQRLVSERQLAAMRKEMRPGDLLFERRNWCMSNIGLPGFWPHAALFVGSPEEIAREFGDGFVERLRNRFPAKWRVFAKPHDDGHLHRVIEAIGKGVVFNSFEHSAAADYVCALRPRLGKEARATAVERAFHYQGRPYDFDFDFASDATLVCSELVWKCYQPGRDQPGLRLPLIRIAGRDVLPPNEMVRIFAREHGTPDQQMDFVRFLDGREKEQTAVDGTLEELLTTPSRSKWDFLQP